MEMIMIKTSSGHKYVNMVRQLQEYMRHKQLPSYMQRRLLSCYEFRFQKSYFRENEILGNISQQLRQVYVTFITITFFYKFKCVFPNAFFYCEYLQWSTE